MPFILQLKLLYPKSLAIIFILMGFVSMNIPFNKVFPAIDLMFIYYWCVYKPHLMPNWFVLSLGIFKDILMGGAIGVNALSNLIIRTITRYKRDDYVKSSFVTLWQIFAILACITIAFKWLVFSLISDKFIEIETTAIQLLLTITLYPLFHSICNSIHSTLPKRFSDA